MMRDCEIITFGTVILMSFKLKMPSPSKVTVFLDSELPDGLETPLDLVRPFCSVF